MPYDWPVWWQYVLALAVVALVLCVRSALDRALGDSLAFLPAFAALLPLVLLVRAGPFLAAAGLGWLGSVYLFVPARMSFRMDDEAGVVASAVYFAAIVLAAVTALLSRRALDERKRKAAALRRSQETFFNLVLNSPFGVYIIDSQFRLRQVSAGAQKVFENVRPLLGRDFADVLRCIWPEPFASEAIDRFRHTLETGEPYMAHDTTERRRDVAEIESYDWRIERITLPDGQFGVVCYFYDLSTLKRAEAELRNRSEQFETLVNQAPLGVYLVDADFRMRQVNPIAEPIFSEFPGGVVGRNFEEVLRAMWIQGRADEIVRIFRNTLESGESFHYPEFAEYRADRGVTEYYDWRVERIVLPDGGYGAVCYFSEISEQVNARLAIAASEEQYRTLFTSIDEGFCVMEAIVDGGGRIVDYLFVEVNPAFEKHTGLGSAAGRRMLEVVPDIEPHWIETFGGVVTSGEPVRFVNEAIPLGRWFDLYAFPVGEPGERKVAVLFTDITDRRRADRIIMAELRDYKRLQEISSRLIPADDVKTLYRELIGAAVEIAEADRGTMQSIDRETGELCLLESKGMSEQVWATFARLSPHASTSCALACRCGERVIVDYESDERVAGSEEARVHLAEGIRAAQSTPLVSRSGKVVGVFTTHWNQPHEPSERSLYLLDILARQAADLVERAASEEALRDADRRKDEFLATLAHELRNPLAAIRMAVGVLDRTEDAARQTQMRAIIERQSSQLVRLIDDLLDVSRITRGKLAMRIEPVDLAQLIEHAVEGVRGMCESKGVRLAVALPKQAITIVADGLRFAQVVSNLLNNACKFTESGGDVVLSAEREGDDAVVRVRDTGVGIPREDLPRIFEMFVQVRGVPGRSPGGEGLGIGLTLSKSIVTLHKGSIEARSGGIGKGSEFIVRVPALPAEARPAAPAAPVAGSVQGAESAAPQERGASGARVLVVDDNRDALDAVVALLRMAGHAVEFAMDGETAVEKARTQRPEVVLLDIGLPVMDGYDVARQIRGEPWGGDVILIAMTGWGQDKDKRNAIEAGFDAHLTKPVDAEELERMLASRSRTEAAVAS
jgi:signal transduction histidine kinase/PAS domain-containing protein/ActR/RegA family two-component response regulator